MMNFLTLLLLLLIVGGASYYVWKQKKRGQRCIGCPCGGQCAGCWACHPDEPQV